MQPKNRNKASDFTPTPMSEILRGISATNRPGPLDDLPPGVPLGQMWDVVNGKLDAKDVTQDPNIEPELQLAARKAEAAEHTGGQTAESSSKQPAPVTPVLDGNASALQLGMGKPQLGVPKVNDLPTCITAADAGSNGRNKHFCTPEDAVLAFFQEAQTLSQSTPHLKKIEYGADIVEMIGDKNEVYFTYNSIELGTGSEVEINVAAEAVAVAHTHPPAAQSARNSKRLSPQEAQDLDDDNQLLSQHDRNRMMKKAQKHVSKKGSHEPEFRLAAYLATPYGEIRRFDYPWDGDGVTVFDGFVFKYDKP